MLNKRVANMFERYLLHWQQPLQPSYYEVRSGLNGLWVRGKNSMSLDTRQQFRKLLRRRHESLWTGTDYIGNVQLRPYRRPRPRIEFDDTGVIV